MLLVKRHLLRWRRERAGDAHPALVAEDEPELAWRPEAVGMVGTKRRAGHPVAYRAQLVFMKKAALAARFRASGPSARDARSTPLLL
jgi:hypothetical protein